MPLRVAPFSLALAAATSSPPTSATSAVNTSRSRSPSKNGSSALHHFAISTPICSPTASTAALPANRSEEHTSELQSLMRISYAVFCLKKKKKTQTQRPSNNYKQQL